MSPKRNSPSGNEPRLPQRPAQHQLEEASRRAFEQRLPREWVFRSAKPDYGIDGEVEIFSGGAATGITFKVQLKGTGSAEDDDLSIRLDRTHDSYYAALRLPVLLVLYQDPTDDLFVRWFHSFDPYSEATTGESVLFRFSREHAWDAETPNQIRREAGMFYRLRDPRRTLPLTLSIEIQDSDIQGVNASEVTARARSLLGPHGDVVRFAPSGMSGEHGTVWLSNDAIRIDLQGAASFTIHLSHETSEQVSPSSLANDIAVVIGLLLDHLRIQVPAARLLEATAESASTLSAPEVALRIGSCLISAGRIETALRLSEKLGTGDVDSSVAADMLRLPLLVEESLTTSDRRRVADHLLSRAELLRSEGPPESAAVNYRNAANWLHSLGQHEDALQALDHALALDPNYEKRSYFHRERGGLLFLLGDYQLAAEAYKKAIEQREDIQVLALYADALMMSGRFAEAQEAFSRYNQESSERNPEWQLKEWVLGHIREIVGDEQDISNDEGCRLAEESDHLDSPEERRDKLLSALRQDGLCGQAWGRLGSLTVEEGQLEEALPALMVAALMIQETGPWMYCVAVAADRIEEQVFRDILYCGYFFCRDDFAEAMGALSPIIQEEDLRGRLERILAEVIEEIHRRQGRAEFRILSGAGYQSIALDPNRPSHDP